MITRALNSLIMITVAMSGMALLPGSAQSQSVRVGFMYRLASFTGPIPYDHARVAVDRHRKETYVLYQNNVRVFNDSGMEVYQFGDDLDLGLIIDLAVDEEGDILLLAYRESRGSIVRCNFRGEPLARIEFKNLPPSYAEFKPNRMIYRDGLFYFASLSGVQIVVTDRAGNFRKAYDLFTLLELEEKDRGNVEIIGFNVDKEGNILLTVPVLFRAITISPAGEMKYFGKPGSAPGRFNVIAGINRDSKGNYMVVDKLKCAVLVFDKNFNFVTQFGAYGTRPENLVFPDEIGIDDADRIYVTQSGRRGVNVYRLASN